MFRSEAQQAAVCEAFCSLVGLTRRFGPWTTDGPSPALYRLIEEGGGPLSTGERALLYVAVCVWGCQNLWPKDGAVPLDTLINKLDNHRLRALGEFMVALASSDSLDVDGWLARHGSRPEPVGTSRAGRRA